VLRALRYDTVLRVYRYVAIRALGLTILLSLPNYQITTYCIMLGYTTQPERHIRAFQMGTFETLAMYSERFHEMYRAYKATASAMNPVDVKDEVQEMDFFHGLDNQR